MLGNLSVDLKFRFFKLIFQNVNLSHYNNVVGLNIPQTLIIVVPFQIRNSFISKLKKRPNEGNVDFMVK